ncbi:cell division topological specificity factor MinE [Aliikangiella maris]|uniref:Cell division topological specificity factor n=2 Tax=Aliikangiella maris TaxID=3162458 RepID=A0ABV2BTN1_9GAMM
MALLDYFKSKKKNTASLAKERLQIIVAHERKNRSGPDYLPQLKQDIIQVVSKYVQVSEENINIELDESGGLDVLELNLTLTEQIKE